MLNQERRVNIGQLCDEHRRWLESRVGEHLGLLSSAGEAHRGRLVECLSVGADTVVVLVCAVDAGDC